MIVVDTNVISYFLISGEFSVLARKAALLDDWCAPVLWRSEFRNVLGRYMRRGLLTEEQARALMKMGEARLWGREYSVRSEPVLSLLSRSQCSAYDCEFVALACDLGFKLISTDHGVISAFPEAAVHLEEYVARTPPIE